MPTNKTPNLAMNLSPISILNRSSPKEKRTFTFFRSRTLSSSSTESNSGGGGGGGSGGNSYNGQGVGPPSPRLSPRTLLDKVRKRSQSDVKSQPSVDHVSTLQHNLQMHLQQQLQEKLLMQQQEQFQQHLLLKRQMLNSNLSQAPIASSSNAILSVSINGGRKHLNHSISEENDESIINEEQDSLNQQSQNPLDALFALSSPNKLKVNFF